MTNFHFIVSKWNNLNKLQKVGISLITSIIAFLILFEFREIQYEIKEDCSFGTKYKDSYVLLCSRFFAKRYTSTEYAHLILRDYEGLEARLNEDKTYIKNVGGDKTLIIVLNPS